MRNIPNFASWINIAVGVMAIISPFALHETSPAMLWSAVITGAVIAVVAIIELAVYPRSTGMNYWPVINILAGIWLLISTALASGATGMIWSDVVLGVTAIITAVAALGYEHAHAEALYQPVTR